MFQLEKYWSILKVFMRFAQSNNFYATSLFGQKY